MPRTKKNRTPELRQDEVSGDWVIISPRRNGKPSDLVKPRSPRHPTSLAACPFENIIRRGEHKIISIVDSPSDWQLVVVTNKYPALEPELSFSLSKTASLYTSAPAAGFHELIITRNHTDNLAHLKPSLATEVFFSAQSRWLAYQKHDFATYGFFFHNWGPAAGASVFHPHYQLMSLPVLPPYIKNSLAGSASYFRRTGRSAYADIIKHELKHRRRLVASNSEALAFVPFAAKDPFHIRLIPKADGAFFEQASARVVTGVVDLLRDILLKFERRLSDPDYNFFVHSAPLHHQSRYRHYRWHIDIIPRISLSGGVEVGTELEVTTLQPEQAAAHLRGRA